MLLKLDVELVDTVDEGEIEDEVQQADMIREKGCASWILIRPTCTNTLAIQSGITIKGNVAIYKDLLAKC